MSSHSNGQHTLHILHTQDVLGGGKKHHKKNNLFIQHNLQMSMYSGGWWRALLEEGVGCRGETAIASVSEHSWECSISKSCTHKTKFITVRHENNDTLAAYGETWI